MAQFVLEARQSQGAFVVCQGVPHRGELQQLLITASLESDPGCSQREPFLANLLADFTSRLNSTWLEDMSKARARPPYLHITARPEVKRDNILLEEQRLSFWMDVLKSLRSPP